MKLLIIILNMVFNMSYSQPCDFQFPSDTTVCQGQSLDLWAFGAANYTWMCPGYSLYDFTIVGDTSVFSLPFPFSTMLTIIGEWEDCHVEVTVSITVTECSKCDFNFPSSISICKGEETRFCALGATEYTFTSNGLLAIFSGANPVTGACITVTPNATTAYTIIASDGACIDTTVIIIGINKCLGMPSLVIGDEQARYFDLWGNPVMFKPGEILIEQKGNSRRKVVYLSD